MSIGSMGAPLRALVAAAVLAFARLALAQGEPSASEWTEIKGVIAAQRDALVSGDGTRAFTYATPAIRRRNGAGSRAWRR